MKWNSSLSYRIGGIILIGLAMYLAKHQSDNFDKDVSSAVESISNRYNKYQAKEIKLSEFVNICVWHTARCATDNTMPMFSMVILIFAGGFFLISGKPFGSDKRIKELEKRIEILENKNG